MNNWEQERKRKRDEYEAFKNQRDEEHLQTERQKLEFIFKTMDTDADPPRP